MWSTSVFALRRRWRQSRRMRCPTLRAAEGLAFLSKHRKIFVGAIHESPAESRISFILPLTMERKRKNQNIFEKSSEHSHLKTPPYPSSFTTLTPVFSPNCGQKSTREENFFQNFQKLFSSRPLVFCLFQNFFLSKCRPRHTFSR